MRAFFHFDVSLFVFVKIRRSEGGQVPPFARVFEAEKIQCVVFFFFRSM